MVHQLLSERKVENLQSFTWNLDVDKVQRRSHDQNPEQSSTGGNLNHAVKFSLIPLKSLNVQQTIKRKGGGAQFSQNLVTMPQFWSDNYNWPYLCTLYHLHDDLSIERILTFESSWKSFLNWAFFVTFLLQTLNCCSVKDWILKSWTPDHVSSLSPLFLGITANRKSTRARTL